MKEKQLQIDYWKKTANEDLEVIDVLFNAKKYLHALFLTHLSLEKILKALWVVKNEANFPPKTHNLINLMNQAGLKLTEEESDFLQSMNTFQLDGRYPDYLSALYKSINRERTEEIINTAKQLFQCLHKKLP
jgi:HEPN domain-containing protein